jgi:hypothetical protein
MSKWGDFGKALTGFGLLSAATFGGRDLQKGLVVGQQSGLIDAVVNLFGKEEDSSGTKLLTDEIQAKNQMIAAQNQQIEIMKQQLAQLTANFSALVTQLQAQAK